MNDILHEPNGDGAKTRDQVRKFIMTNFYVPDEDALGEQASLLDEGVVDSTGVLEVIAFIESEFGIAVEDLEITPENFDSIGRIAAYVERKRT